MIIELYSEERGETALDAKLSHGMSSDAILCNAMEYSSYIFWQSIVQL